MEAFILPSLLDKDDLSGPSKGKFPRSDKGLSVDYALFKISIYMTIENLNEKMKYIKDIDVLINQLGKNNPEMLFNLFNNIINDKITIVHEFARSLKKILPLIQKNGPTYIEQFIPILEKLLDMQAQVLELIEKDLKEISNCFDDECKNKWLVTTLLNIVHDEDKEKQVIGVKMLNQVIEMFNEEVCTSFIIPEIMVLLTNDEIGKLMALELISPVAKVVKSPENLDKLIRIFMELCEDSSASVKIKAVGKFPDFSFCEDSIQIQKIQPCFKELLKDKSEKVKKKALLQLGPLITSTKAPFPHPLLDMYLKLAKNASNDRDLQYHFAYYFPGVLEIMGKESWNTLQDSYMHLAINGDQMTKRSIAASLHHIANLLQEKATEEIFPIFLNYIADKSLRSHVMKDCDVLLKSFDADSRYLILDHLKSISKDKNFRTRLILAENIGKLGVLFKPNVCFDSFWPICKTLCLDSIGVVRNTAINNIGQCAVHIMIEGPEYSNELLKDLKKFVNSANSQHRIVFAAACLHLITLHEFEVAFGDDFVKLTNDKVPAVRILCSKVVKKAIGMSSRKFWTDLTMKMKTDDDFDVRNEVIEEFIDVGYVKAGESTETIKPPAVRNKLREKEFDNGWEILGNEFSFAYLEKVIRPCYEGYA